MTSQHNQDIYKWMNSGKYFLLKLIYSEKATIFFEISTLLLTTVSFSSCQRTLIKTFQIEAMIALITKMRY